MKYFILEVDKNYVAPSPKGWYGVIDTKTLEEKKHYELSKHMLFHVEEHMQMVFTDIITYPCFLISDKIRKVIKLYDHSIKYVRVVLY